MRKQYTKLISDGDHGSVCKDDSKELLSSAQGPDAKPNSYIICPYFSLLPLEVCSCHHPHFAGTKLRFERLMTSSWCAATQGRTEI